MSILIDASANVHPSAILEDGAEIGPGVTIGPYAYIGAHVRLGAGTIIHHHATVDGLVRMGDGNQVFPYAFIGGKTQDLKYTGGQPGLRIGDNNVFREYASVHPATNDGEYTSIGNGNTILAYSHIAHDCVLGDGIVMSGHNALAGHVTVGDHAIVAWGCGIHQFCRVGTFAMVGAMSRNSKDAPPYMIVEGEPAEVRAVNKVGLERRGFEQEAIHRIGRMFRILYRENLNRSQAIEKIAASPDLANSPEGREIIRFYTTTTRGVA
ncbi:MAG: acyl-ACP--UDP-N-acetylglucosamine O-acyltransferase [Puniceicoccales bacterium]|jgi:UDP-N-acetylglucosamine acyltransferase|nr:acyl-ACP--UDP-N-acetylglucosamine O-acyltransferase [Puniceicoccales bacterium]